MDELRNQPKKEPEDIFAASAFPDARPAPVDPWPAVLPTKTSSGSDTPYRRKVGSGKRRVMILMVSAILLIMLLGGGAVAFFYSMSLKAPNTTSTIDEQAVDDTIENDTGTAISEVVIDEAEEQDTDRDGLTDIREVELGLDLTKPDTDDDGLSDKDEVDIYGTDPFDQDTDDDGFFDGIEVRQGYNPKGSGNLKIIAQ